MARTLRTLLGGLMFGEGPRWREGRLWFSDMWAGEVVAMTPDGVRETILTAPGPVSGLGWLPDGRLLVVSMVDRRLMRREADGSLVEHADLSAIASFHCNDMVVDARGCAYVGNFGWDLADPEAERRPAKLARIGPDGGVSVAAEELIFPNGMAITPDGKTLIVGETFAARMTAFDRAEDGSLSNRRVWAALPEGSTPDGCCLDAEGAIWVASPYTNEVLRVHEGGRISERLETGRGPYACMLGGEARRTLFILVADAPPEERTAGILSTEVEIAGAGWP